MKQFILFLFAVILSSCNTDDSALPSTTEEAGVVSIYIPEEYKAQGIEEAIKENILEAHPSISGEYNFKLKYVKSKDKDSLRARNVIEINIDKKNDNEIYVKSHDLNAVDQYYAIIYGQSVEDIIHIFNTRGEQIKASVSDKETKRAQRLLNINANKNITNLIREIHNIEITVPKSYRYVKYNQDDVSLFIGEDFLTNKFGKHIIQKYLMVYNYSFTGDRTLLQPEMLKFKINVALRDYAEYNNNNDTLKAFLQISPDSADAFDMTPIFHQNKYEGYLLEGLFKTKTEYGRTVLYGGHYVARVIIDHLNDRVLVGIIMLNVPKVFSYTPFIRNAKLVLESIKL